MYVYVHALVPNWLHILYMYVVVGVRMICFFKLIFILFCCVYIKLLEYWKGY